MASPTPIEHILADIVGAVVLVSAVVAIGWAIWKSGDEDRRGLMVIVGEGDEDDDEDDEDDEAGGDDGGCVADGCGAGPDEGDRS